MDDNRTLLASQSQRSKIANIDGKIKFPANYKFMVANWLAKVRLLFIIKPLVNLLL